MTRIVYVPPAPAPSAPADAPQETGTFDIPEQRPAEPEEALPPAEPAPVAKPTPKRSPRPARPESGNEAEPEPDPARPVEFPVLEPAENPGQQSAQRQQVADLQDRVRARITRLQRSNLSTESRRMLEDARTFLTQSEEAVKGSDFQRALNLVRKASMLATVLEQE